MHKLQVRWNDKRETEHTFKTMEQFKEFVTIAKLLNASLRFYAESYQKWTRWS